VRALAGALVLLALGSGPAFGLALTDDPSDLPYRLTGASPMCGAPRSLGLIDVDGDGIDECVRVASAEDETYWQWSIERLIEGTRFAIVSERSVDQLGCAGVVELGGQSARAIALWRQDDEQLLLFCVSPRLDREVVLLDTIATFAWDIEGALLPTGIWRGDVELVDAVDRDGDGTSESLIALLQGGVLGRPRGIWILDIESGQAEWSIGTGGVPVGGPALVDVDADGSPELVLAVEPSGSATISGRWDDLSSRVVCIELGGEVLWEREVGGSGSGVSLRPVRTERGLRIAVGVRNPGGDLPGLLVLNGEGRRVDAALEGTSVLDLDCADGRLFLACGDGALRRASLQEGRLAVDRVLECGAEVRSVRVASFGPPLRSSGVFVATAGGLLGVVSTKLRPLAALATTEAGPPPRGGIATGRFGSHDGPRGGVAASTADRLRFLVLARREMEAWVFVLAAVVGGAGVVAAAPRSRRASLSWLREHITPASERGEVLDDVLEELRSGGHGKLSITRPVRHLIDNLRMLGDQDGGITESFRTRFEEMIGRARTDGIVTIDRLRRSSERIGLAPEATATLARSVRDLRSILSEMSGEIPPEKECLRHADRLDRALAPVTAALTAVRDRSREERSASLGAALDEAVRPWREEAARRGVRIETPDLRTLRSIRVHATSAELEHAFDNLTGNALRALEGTADPVLSVSCLTEANEVRVRFEDNGRGIEPERHESIFLEGVSDRAGGGSGLPASRERLTRRNGNVVLVRSAPGEGSMFEVRLLTV